MAEFKPVTIKVDDLDNPEKIPQWLRKQPANATQDQAPAILQALFNLGGQSPKGQQSLPSHDVDVPSNQLDIINNTQSFELPETQAQDYRLKALDAIKRYETRNGKPDLMRYNDDKGIPTIGYGFNLKDKFFSDRIPASVRAGLAPIDPKLADQLLEERYDIAERDAKKYYGDGYDALPGEVKAVLSDVSYNAGYPKLIKFKGMRNALKAGDYKRAAEELKYIAPGKSKQLTPYFTNQRGTIRERALDNYNRLLNAINPFYVGEAEAAEIENNYPKTKFPPDPEVKKVFNPWFSQTMAGINMLNAHLARIPAYMYEIANWSRNASFAMLGYDYRDNPPEWMRNNPLTRYFERSAIFYDQSDERFGTIIELIDGETVTRPKNFEDILAEGDSSETAAYIGWKILENAPQQLVILGTQMTGIGELGLGMLALTSAASKSQENAQNDIDTVKSALNASFAGLMEYYTEKMFGTANVYKKTVKEISDQFGKKAGWKIMKDAGKAIAKGAVIEEPAEEVVNEFAVTFADWAMGINPEAFNGLPGRMLEAALVAAGSSFTMTAPSGITTGISQGRQLSEIRNRERVAELRGEKHKRVSVYRGSLDQEAELKRSKSGYGTFVTTNKDYARSYGENITEGSIDTSEFYTVSPAEYQILRSATSNNLKQMQRTIVARARKQGYKGVDFKTGTYTVFDPSDIQAPSGDTRYKKSKSFELTKNFKNWFKKSKVVDRNGKPLIVFHATPHKFNVFDLEKARENVGLREKDLGFHFGTEAQANHIRSNMEFNQSEEDLAEMDLRTIPAYLSIQNPFVTNIDAGHVHGDERAVKIQNILADGFGIRRPAAKYINTIKQMRDFLIQEGYDGIKYRNAFEGDVKSPDNYSWIAFYPEQIKSVHNTGAFDTKNKDIRYKKAPTFYSHMERTIEEKMGGAGTGEQILKTLKNAGVKQEELTETGVEEFLQGKDKVSKEELLAFVDTNRIEVKEVEKTGEGSGRMINAESVKEGDSVIVYGEQHAVETIDSDPDTGETAIYFADGGDVVLNWNDKVEVRRGKATTKFQQYQLPGGENYKELLLTLPERKPIIDPSDRKDYSVKTLRSNEYYGQRDVEVFYKGERMYLNTGTRRTDEQLIDAAIANQTDVAKNEAQFKSSHFDEPNILAHVRFNDRKTEAGKTLFLEEVQSDWHQAGRSQGYMKPSDERKEYPTETVAERVQAIIAANKAGVPNAPFKKTWHELALKRMLRYAAENGYDAIAWTTGEQQADRYDLSKQIDSLSYQKTGENSYSIDAYKDDNSVISKQGLSASQLADTVGKEIADKIVNDKGKDSGYGEDMPKYLEGVDLKVGGEGMKGFYDRMIPSFLNKYTKKWGGRVGESSIETSKEYSDQVGLALTQLPEATRGRINTLAVEEAEEKGLDPNDDDYMDFVVEREAELAENWIKNNAGKNKFNTKVHSLQLTPHIKEAVLKGQPMFKRQGSDELANEMGYEEVQKRNKEGMEFIQKYLPEIAHLVRNPYTLFTAAGEKLLGQYLNGEITVVNGQPLPVYKHEGFHAFFDLFVSDAKKVAALDAVHAEHQERVKRYAEENKVSEDVAAEEVLAEIAEAIDHNQFEYDGKTISQKLINIISEFIEAMQAFFGMPKARINQLYRAMYSGKRELNKAGDGRGIAMQKAASQYKSFVTPSGGDNLRAINSMRSGPAKMELYRTESRGGDRGAKELWFDISEGGFASELEAYQGGELKKYNVSVDSMLVVNDTEDAVRKLLGRRTSEEDIMDDESGAELDYELTKAARKKGYDAIFFKERGHGGTEVVVLNPKNSVKEWRRGFRGKRAGSAFINLVDSYMNKMGNKKGAGIRKIRAEDIKNQDPSKVEYGWDERRGTVSDLRVGDSFEYGYVKSIQDMGGGYISVKLQGPKPLPGYRRQENINTKKEYYEIDEPITYYRPPKKSKFTRKHIGLYAKFDEDSGNIVTLIPEAKSQEEAYRIWWEYYSKESFAEGFQPSLSNEALDENPRYDTSASDYKIGQVFTDMFGDDYRVVRINYEKGVVESEPLDKEAAGDIIKIRKVNPSSRPKYKKAPKTYAEQEFALPKEKLFEGFRRSIEDFNLRLKTLNSEIEKVAGSKIQEHLDLWAQKDMLPRQQSDILRRIRSEKEMFVRRMVEADVTVEGLNEYLHAKHAQERNAKMNALRAQKGKEPADGLSGMTDAKAQEVLSRDNSKYEPFEKEIRNRIRKTLQFEVDQGLIKKDDADVISAAYSNYIPLYRDMGEEGDSLGIGQGADIRGKEVKRAKGSTRRVTSPLGNAFFQQERAQIRALKNKIGQTVIEMQKQYPFLKDFFEVEAQKYLPRFNEDGELQFLDPKFKLGDNVLGTKIDGKQYFITIKDQMLARALKNQNIARLPRAMSFLRTFIGLWSSFKTRWRPEFLITNFQRDLGEGMINLGVEKSQLKGKGKWLRAKVARDLFPSQRRIWKYIRGGDDAQVDEFFSLGGDAGHFWLESAQDSEASLMELEKRIRGGGVENLKNAGRAALDFVDDVNSMVEMGIRFSTYKNLVQAGVSKKRAVQSAADLTINFSRQGEISPILKSLYGFINPAIQGTSKVVRSVASKEGGKRVLKSIVGLTALGFLTRVISMLISPDDDEQIPDWDKNHKIVFTLGNGRRIILWQMPYGYTAFFSLGSNLAELLFKEKTMREAGINVLATALNSFTPFENLRDLTPTQLKPIFEVNENRGWYGGKIHPEQIFTKTPLPNSAIAFDRTANGAVFAAKLMNRMTGGDADTSGLVDLHPEDLQYLYDQYFGGPFEFISSSIEAGADFTQGDFDPNKTPFVRQFYRKNKPESWAYGVIYDTLDRAYRKDLSEMEVERFYKAIDEARAAGADEDRINNNVRDFVRARYKMSGAATSEANINKLDSMTEEDRKRYLNAYSERTRKTMTAPKGLRLFKKQNKQKSSLLLLQ